MELNIYASFIISGKVGGAENMALNLVDGLIMNGCKINLYLNKKRYSSNTLYSSSKKNLNIYYKRDKIKLNRFFYEQFISLFGASNSGYRLYLNYHTPLQFKFQKNKVLTVIHDLQYLHYPSNFSLLKRKWLWYSHRKTLKRADLIIAISDTVRNDILKSYGQQFANKVHSVHNPISWDRFNDSKNYKLNLDFDFILTVSAQYKHKNITTLIEAFHLVKSVHPKLKLVIIGQDYKSLRGVVRDSKDRYENKDDDIIFTGYISDKELGAYYYNAKIFAFPSLFEGFGMPVIEAQGFGLPIVVSDIEVMREITYGNTKLVKDYTSAKSWSQSLHEVLNDIENYRLSENEIKKLIKAYSPKNIASKYIDVMKGK
tara:strand:- start:140 stop:1252 length:1113 start_codon:yes stop_codon:yes gene_type:complete